LAVHLLFQVLLFFTKIELRELLKTRLWAKTKKKEKTNP